MPTKLSLDSHTYISALLAAAKRSQRTYPNLMSPLEMYGLLCEVSARDIFHDTWTEGYCAIADRLADFAKTEGDPDLSTMIDRVAPDGAGLANFFRRAAQHEHSTLLDP